MLGHTKIAAIALLMSGCIPFDGVGSVSIGQRVMPDEGAYICTPDDRAHIYIPPGALAEPTVITITEVELADRGVVGSAFDFGPDGTRFLVPVWIQLHPGPLPEGRSLSELSLFHLSDGVVEELSDVTVDEANGTIAGYATHFSTFYAALAGPATGGRGIRVGGPGLAPLFGASTTATSPPEVDVRVGPGGMLSTNPYTGPFTDTLILQVDGGSAVEGQPIFVDGWTIDPVDPEVTVGPTGDRISTRGFWHDLFASEILVPMRDARTDAQGRVVLAIRGDALLRHMEGAPAGYSSGRFRLRVLSADPADAVDIIVSFAPAP